MPYVSANGIRLAYERTGEGDPVLFIMGSGAGGRAWTTHQTPAVNKAGYQSIIFDNRGIAPSDVPAGRYSLADMVADTVGLIEALDLGPCHVVGTSMGSSIAQEIAVDRPELVRSAVMLATRSRSDVFRRALSRADQVLAESGVRLPPEYASANTVFQMFSPKTLNDDGAVSLWLDVFELYGASDSGADGQAWVDTASDRRERLRRITVPCRVIAFSDDVICPPHLAAEVAEAIPECDFVEIGDAGHLGNLERPDEVNTAITEFLDKF
ncbi:pimeloyl-ACP methyl ester carboxylesterase [Streptomyces sp. Ag109_O5-1]|uniref:alpha/beta fold hydrolase n=1 Tax=Streptomyces sp. Ag109_O5-1 TaxID=1938851 RepID=UPI000F4FF816|nr:alpha/beta hydrolase [Streptomyces sp. Ag109_O5-1]RPE41530.1 pimeloyl-ACP methyl ester carboxylesterase [Streptomyces sp. Ag109_O5-1]